MSLFPVILERIGAWLFITTRFADFEQEVQQIMDSAKLEVSLRYFYVSVRSMCSVKVFPEHLLMSD